jgi:DNA invertase Pin-like site-specific DNA recombinase
MMKGQKIGYIRVSSIDQNTDRQLAAIRLDKIFEEKVSGKDIKRPQLEAMLSHIREGDHVYVHELSRLGRSMIDLHQLVEQILKKDVSITFVKEKLTYASGQDADPMQEAMFGMLSVFSQFERSLIKQRQKEGIAAAKKAGKHLGRPIKLTDEQKIEIIGKHKGGSTPSQLSKEYGVSRGTIYNIIN